MSLLVVFWVLVSLSMGVLPPPDYVNCDNTREAVLECASFLFDLDHDGRITTLEMDQVLPTLVSLPARDMTSDYLLRCDMDDDGTLTMDDWNHPNSTCLPTPNCVYIACLVCVRNGFQMSHPEEAKSKAYDYEGLAKFAKENADKLRESYAKREKAAKELKARVKHLAGKHTHPLPPPTTHKPIRV